LLLERVAGSITCHCTPRNRNTTEFAMSEDDGPKNDRFYVTLRVYHDDLDADHISRVLGLVPTHIHRRDQPYREGGRLLAPTGAWFFGSKDALDSSEFEDHITWLLDRLDGKGEAIRRLRNEGYEVEVSCYWLHVDLNRNLILSPSIMRRLVELDLTIWVDTYC
jgi:hypothetical protein